MRPPSRAVPRFFTHAWDPVVVQECARGVHRFDQLQRRLRISRKTLAERLKSLVEEGVLERNLYQSRPDRFEYHLTPKGLDLLPVLVAMASWQDRWDGEASPRSGPEHASCGEPCSARVVCTHCGQDLHGDDIVLGGW
jgi:DNA-binding HxlR family transcriptional regulator